MKKHVVSAVILFFMPALALAQDTDHRYRGQAYGVFGLAGPSDSHSLTTKYVGGGGELFLYKGLGAGFEGGFARWGPGIFNQNWLASTDLSYHFRPNTARTKLEPFIVGGFSLYIPTSQGAVDGAGNFGGGVNWWFKPRAALRLEIRDVVNLTNAGPGNHFLSFRVGMTFR